MVKKTSKNTSNPFMTGAKSTPGRVSHMVRAIRELPNLKLVHRYRDLVRAQAIRQYLAAKEDTALTVEIRLIEEEMHKRFKGGSSKSPPMFSRDI